MQPLPFRAVDAKIIRQLPSHHAVIRNMTVRDSFAFRRDQAIGPHGCCSSAAIVGIDGICFYIEPNPQLRHALPGVLLIAVSAPSPWSFLFLIWISGPDRRRPAFSRRSKAYYAWTLLIGAIFLWFFSHYWMGYVGLVHGSNEFGCIANNGILELVPKLVTLGWRAPHRSSCIWTQPMMPTMTTKSTNGSFLCIRQIFSRRSEFPFGLSPR